MGTAPAYVLSNSSLAPAVVAVDTVGFTTEAGDVALVAVDPVAAAVAFALGVFGVAAAFVPVALAVVDFAVVAFADAVATGLVVVEAEIDVGAATVGLAVADELTLVGVS